MKLNVQGLLSRISELPGVINQGLLGPLPTNPNMGLDPQSLSQARQAALTDMAYGMLATPQGNRAGGLAFARQNAQEGYRGRIIDIMRENETARLMSDRTQREANEAQYLAGLPPELQSVARVAGAQGTAQKQIEAALSPGSDGRTDDIKEYQLAVQQGFKGTLQDWILSQKKAGASSTSVYLPPEQSSFLKGVGEKAAGQLDTLQTSADSAAKLLASINKLKPITENPAFISGTLGDARLVVAKALGLPGATETQAYFAAVGEQVAERIKAFGAGTGLSDADREFAKQIAAGSIELTPAAIKRIIRINEQSANELLNKYHERRTFYSKKNPEVLDYFPEVTVPGSIKITRIK